MAVRTGYDRVRLEAVRNAGCRGLFDALRRLPPNPSPRTESSVVLKHPPGYVRAVSEAAATATDSSPADVRTYVKHFLDKSPVFSNEPAGIAAVRFEAWLIEHDYPLLATLVETIAEPGRDDFHAIFYGKLLAKDVEELIGKVADFVKLTVETEAGRISTEDYAVSDLTVLRGVPVAGENKPGDDALPKPDDDTVSPAVEQMPAVESVESPPDVIARYWPELAEQIERYAGVITEVRRSTGKKGEAGRWVTTERGAKLFIDASGTPTKGNPHLLAALSKKGGNESKKHDPKADADLQKAYDAFRAANVEAGSNRHDKKAHEASMRKLALRTRQFQAARARAGATPAGADDKTSKKKKHESDERPPYAGLFGTWKAEPQTDGTVALSFYNERKRFTLTRPIEEVAELVEAVRETYGDMTAEADLMVERTLYEVAVAEGRHDPLPLDESTDPDGELEIKAVAGLSRRKSIVESANRKRLAIMGEGAATVALPTFKSGEGGDDGNKLAMHFGPGDWVNIDGHDLRIVSIRKKMQAVPVTGDTPESLQQGEKKRTVWTVQTVNSGSQRVKRTFYGPYGETDWTAAEAADRVYEERIRKLASSAMVSRDTAFDSIRESDLDADRARFDRVWRSMILDGQLVKGGKDVYRVSVDERARPGSPFAGRAPTTLSTGVNTRVSRRARRRRAKRLRGIRALIREAVLAEGGDAGFDIGDVQQFFDLQIVQGKSTDEAIRLTKKQFKLNKLKAGPTDRVESPDVDDATSPIDAPMGGAGMFGPAGGAGAMPPENSLSAAPILGPGGDVPSDTGAPSDAGAPTDTGAPA